MTAKITNISKEKKRIWHQGKFVSLLPGESYITEKSLNENISSHPDFRVEEVSEEKKLKTKKTVAGE